MNTASYPFDTTGLAPSNLVQNELHTLTEVNSAPYRILIPSFAPFYLHNLLVEHIGTTGTPTPLTEGVDYYCVLPYMAASRSVGKSLYGGLAFISDLVQGTIRLKYQTLGGSWCADKNYVYEQLLSAHYNRRTTWWDTLTNVQETFPPTDHDHNAEDIEGHTELLAKLDEIRTAILQSPNLVPAQYLAHLMAKGNVHDLNKSDLGLGDVSNLPLATDQEVLSRIPSDKYVTLRQILMLLS